MAKDKNSNPTLSYHRIVAKFGLGAEVGISTQKLHARGSLGLKELTSYKWIIFGSGQVCP